MPSLTIRRFDQDTDNKEDLINLLKPVFKKTWQTINDKWEWQYLKNPFCKDPSVYIASYNGDMAGAIGCIPVKMSIHGKVIDAVWMTEAITNPKYRRMGISMKLHEKIEEDFTFVLAKSISDMILPLTKKRNYYFIENAVYMIRILNLTTFIRSRIFKKTKKESGQQERTGQKVAGIEIVTSFNHKYDALADHLCSKYPITVLRTSEYLQWRYIDCPVVDYTVISVTSGHAISGYIVVRTSENKGLKCGWIVDVMVDPDDSNSFNELIRKALVYLKSMNASCVYTLGSHRILKKYYYRNLFFPTKTIARVVAKHKDKMPDVKHDANFWHLVEGDSDSDLFKH